MIAHISTILCLFIVPQVLGKLDYCQHVIDCAHIRNVVCQRGQQCGPTDRCTEISLKRSTKVYILLSLNEYRNDVALGRVKGFPNASDMVAQYWDDDLEYVTICAQNICEKQGAEICANTAKYSNTILLQNIQALRDVTDEVDFFEKTLKTWLHPEGLTVDQIDQFTNTSLAKYAAILWSNSPAVGCALSRDSNLYYGACTFALAPRRGEHVYYRGEPCSGCPKGLKCNEEYHGLCGEILLPRALSGAAIMTCNLVLEILVGVIGYVLG